MSDWNWKEIRDSIDQEPWHETYDGDYERGIFIGTVFQLTPSGKYYTFWTSNQTEEDIEKDTEFWEEIESEAEQHNLSVTSGEGDPCDILVMEYKDELEEGDILGEE